MRNVIAAVVACAAALLLPRAEARGVSPYLPVNLSPEIEYQIEQVLILAGQPVLTRPIAAATVLDALPKACHSDQALCDSVRRYLNRYMRRSGVMDAAVDGTNGRDSKLPVPNQHGMRADSDWHADARVYWQPEDWLLVAVGANAYDGDVTPTGSLISVGGEFAQIDVGYRDHWLSPLSDSSMTLSTEARTMPSIGISNYTPMTRFGFKYEFFLAQMSHSDKIVHAGGFTSGTPRLAGTHFEIEPMSGWAFGVNRLMQYGGGERGNGGLRALFDAFIKPSKYDNFNTATDNEFGNQVASITSSFTYPGRVPFAAYIEYAGEDTVRGREYLLGNAALSVGMHFPMVFKNFDLTVEASEWQNGWYVHHIYLDGLTVDRNVIGHWAADQRVFGDGVSGNSEMLRLGWRAPFGGLAELRYRTAANDTYTGEGYERSRELSFAYSRQFGSIVAGAEVISGRDLFGASDSQVRVFARLSELADEFAGGRDDPGFTYSHGHNAELFVDVGVNAMEVQIDENSDLPRTKTGVEMSPHLGIGARRLGSGPSDIGVRLELDSIDDNAFVAVRAIDYRYRFHNPLAFNFFVGAARYDKATAAYGLYYGLGAQWRDVVRGGWDLNLDARYAEKVNRDHVLPGELNQGTRGSYYDIYGVNLYLTKRF